MNTRETTLSTKMVKRRRKTTRTYENENENEGGKTYEKNSG